MPKRKSKPTKGLEQPVAKKREIHSKQTNVTDSTPVVRSRGGTRSEASSPIKGRTPQIRIEGSAKKKVGAIRSANKRNAAKENGTDVDDNIASKSGRSSRTTTPTSSPSNKKVLRARTPRATTPVSMSQSVDKKKLRTRTPRATTPVASSQSVGERVRAPSSTAKTHSAARRPISQSAKGHSSKATTPVAISGRKARERTPRVTTTPVIVLRSVDGKFSAKKTATASAKNKAHPTKNSPEKSKKLSPKKLSLSGKRNSKVSPKKSPKTKSEKSRTKNSPGSSKEVSAISRTVNESQLPRTSSFTAQRCCLS